MKIINHFKVFSFFLITAYLLVACGGTLPKAITSAKGPKVESNVVAFTGIVEAINGTQWTVSRQALILDPQVSLDPNIAVGDPVKVEANVSANGAVVALKVESAVANDAVATSSADINVNSTSDPSSIQAAGGTQNEIFGTVEAITTNTITIDGSTYNLASFTEIKGPLAVGDQVKLYVTVNADGSLTVREVEKSNATTVDNHSSNSNGSYNGPNHDLNQDNSNSSSNGSDDSPNHDSNDDHGGNNGSGHN